MAWLFVPSRPSEYRISNEIKAWLSRIAYNELINFLRKNPDEKELSNPFRIKSYDLSENIADMTFLDDDQKYTPPSIEKNTLELGLKSLSVRERYILIVYMQHFHPSQPMRHLPEDVLNAICEKFNIKPANARKIKERALTKLKLYIEKSNINK